MPIIRKGQALHRSAIVPISNAQNMQTICPSACVPTSVFNPRSTSTATTVEAYSTAAAAHPKQPVDWHNMAGTHSARWDWAAVSWAAVEWAAVN